MRRPHRMVSALEFPDSPFLSQFYSLSPRRLNTVQAVSRERQMQSRRSSEIKLSCKGEQPAQNANKVTDYSAGAITFFLSLSLRPNGEVSPIPVAKPAARDGCLDENRYRIPNTSAYTQTTRISWQ